MANEPVKLIDSPADDRRRRLLKFLHVVKGRPLGTIENLEAIFSERDIRCRYNVISKRILIDIPGESYSVENAEDVSLALIHSYIVEEEMPVTGYKPHTLRIADRNQYNPVLDWIKSKPWDGSDRLEALYATIDSPEPEARNLLLRRWLITAVCMALGEGMDSAGCLVLQGPQDIGKTWWVKKLVPEHIRDEFVRTDATVDPKDKDSVSQVISYWIVELGEIGATFAKAELQALKGFITRNHDIMRRPYGEGDKKYPRRTALIASVDQTIFLHDTAGNRRFWTIPCTDINSYHTIDMQQLWAQVMDLVEKAETGRLAADEKAHIARINNEHMQIEPIIEKIRGKYDLSQYGLLWKSATDIAEEIGFRNVTQRETRIINSFMVKAGVEVRISRGNKQYRVSEYSILDGD